MPVLLSHESLIRPQAGPDGLTDGRAYPQINIFAKLQTQSPKCQIRASQLFILAQKLHLTLSQTIPGSPKISI